MAFGNGDDEVKRKNGGFTLMELIVVMAIIGVVILAIGISISASTSAKAEKTAASINALISKCRVGCLSKAGDVSLTISLDAVGNIICTYSENGTDSTDTFTGGGISVSYTTRYNGGTDSKTELSQTTPLTLSFDRSTGGLEPQANGSECTSIIVTGGRSYTISIVPSTGSHRLV